MGRGTAIRAQVPLAEMLSYAPVAFHDGGPRLAIATTMRAIWPTRSWRKPRSANRKAVAAAH